MKKWRTKLPLPGIPAGTIGKAFRQDSFTFFGDHGIALVFEDTQMVALPDFFEEFEEVEWWRPRKDEAYFAISEFFTVIHTSNNVDGLGQLRSEAIAAAEHLKSALREWHKKKNEKVQKTPQEADR